jgi:DNA-binding PadR family transcriptional regulator
MKDLDILMAIMKRGGKARYSEIESDVKSSNVNKRLRRLEEVGYIRRKVVKNTRPPLVLYIITRNGLNYVEGILLSLLDCYIVVRPKRLKTILEDYGNKCPKYIKRVEARKKGKKF